MCSSWTSTSRTSSARSIRTGATACTSGEDTLDDYYDEHEYVNIDAKARSGELFILDESKENSEHAWKVRQIIDDSDGDHDWAITGTVDLDATQSSGEVVFFDYSVSN